MALHGGASTEQEDRNVQQGPAGLPFFFGLYKKTYIIKVYRKVIAVTKWRSSFKRLYVF